MTTGDRCPAPTPPLRLRVTDAPPPTPPLRLRVTDAPPPTPLRLQVD